MKQLKQRLRVREIAEERGFTAAQLSRAANLNQGTVYALFRNPYRDVSYSTLARIAEVLEVEITKLVEYVPDDRTD